MARAKVVHSTNSVAIIFEGNKANPEPDTGVIKFPGGHVEVSRCSNGQYWAHLEIYQDRPISEDDSRRATIVDSRIDYDHEQYTRDNGKISPIPHEEHIVKMAVKVGLMVPLEEIT